MVDLVSPIRGAPDPDARRAAYVRALASVGADDTTAIAEARAAFLDAPRATPRRGPLDPQARPESPTRGRARERRARRAEQAGKNLTWLWLFVAYVVVKIIVRLLT